MGAGVTGLIGLTPARFAPVGMALGLAGVVALATAVTRGYRPDALASAAIAALLAQNLLQAILRAPYGSEWGSRSGYIYSDVIFLWLVIAGIAGDRLKTLGSASERESNSGPVIAGIAGGRPTAPRWSHRTVVIAAGVLLLPMVLGNMWQLTTASVRLRHQRATELAELRMTESLRTQPGIQLDVQFDPAYSPGLTARAYYAAIDRFGSPTLGWDWRSDVDAAAVEAARQRLLPGSR